MRPTTRTQRRHSFGEQFGAKKWAKEAAGQRDIMAAYAGVRHEDIRGLRAPFLSVSRLEWKNGNE